MKGLHAEAGRGSPVPSSPDCQRAAVPTATRSAPPARARSAESASLILPATMSGTARPTRPLPPPAGAAVRIPATALKLSPWRSAGSRSLVRQQARHRQLMGQFDALDMGIALGERRTPTRKPGVDGRECRALSPPGSAPGSRGCHPSGRCAGCAGVEEVAEQGGGLRAARPRAGRRHGPARQRSQRRQ